MKVKPFLFPALIAVFGIVLLFVLIPKIWGILLILLGLVYGYVRHIQLKHPEIQKTSLKKPRFSMIVFIGCGISMTAELQNQHGKVFKGLPE